MLAARRALAAAAARRGAAAAARAAPHHAPPPLPLPHQHHRHAPLSPPGWAAAARRCSGVPAAATPLPPAASGVAHWASVYGQLSKFKLRRVRAVAPAAPRQHVRMAAR
jgi:hypothetical protein